MTTIAQVEELYHRGLALPDGPTKVALFEEAVNCADDCGNMDWRFCTRYELIRAGFSAGEPDRMLVALSWCLAKCAELGGCYNQGYLLWGSKFALSYITCFPHISRTQITDLQAEVTERFRQYGASLRTPYIYGMKNHLAMGYPREAAEYHKLWWAAPRDSFAESEEWERYFEVNYRLRTEEPERALELGLPMLDGQVPANDVYHWMVDLLLMKLLERRDRRRAVDGQRQAYRSCSRNPKFVAHVGTQLHFLALTGNHARALGLLEKHLAWALDSCVVSSCFSFYLKCWAALHFIAQHGKSELRLRLPDQFPAHRDDGVYDCGELAGWFERQTRELEAQFNARNGNTYFTELVEKTLDYDRLAIDWSIT